MTAHAVVESLASLALLVGLAIPLGLLLARVFRDGARPTRVEAWLLRLAGVDGAAEMTWRQYAVACLAFNLLGIVVLFLILRFQASLPLNPAGLGPVDPWVAWNTAVSFGTNTNWQSYGGETTLSHLSQMAGLTTQNVLSPAVGLAVLVALARGFVRSRSVTVGNFWFDLTRATAIMLAISALWAVLLVSQGVPQTLAGTVTTPLVEGSGEQTISVGPVASQVAIKQLGTNGGGYFNVNSAHPLENPSPVTNTLEWLALLLIPFAQLFAFGVWVKDRRQSWALLAAVLGVLVPLLGLALWSELSGVPALAGLGVDPSAGHLEGKESRFGVVSSVLWAAATTAASNGSVNAMHDSLTPLAGLVPMWLMQLGEIIGGGVGSGLYGLLLYAIIAVFIAGLMVGRTPEYLGKKIEAKEMQMAALGILLPAAAVLVGTAIASVTEAGTGPRGNPGAHGFSEMLYAFSSGANNNGSAFGGLTVSGPFYATAIGVAMLVGRYWVIIPVLAIAGSLAAKKSVPVSAGTLPTHTPLFGVLLFGTIVLVGALTFIPALALGPVVEHLQMAGGGQ